MPKASDHQGASTSPVTSKQKMRRQIERLRKAHLRGEQAWQSRDAHRLLEKVQQACPNLPPEPTMADLAGLRETIKATVAQEQAHAQAMRQLHWRKLCRQDWYTNRSAVYKFLREEQGGGPPVLARSDGALTGDISETQA